MTTILDILGASTPVSDILADKLGYVKAAIACRVFFYEQLKEGVCRASINTLAKKLGMSTGTISSNLKWLRDNGWVEVIGEHKSGNRPNKYKVTSKFYEALEHSSDEGETPENDASHSADESHHSSPESYFQEMNGEEVFKEEVEEETTTTEESEEERATEKEEQQKNGSSSGGSDLSKITTAYENEIGLLSPLIADEIKDSIDTYPTTWILDAIGVAATQNVRKWSYVRGVLKKWQTNGRGDKPASNGTGKDRQPVLDPVTGKPIPGAYYGS